MHGGVLVPADCKEHEQRLRFDHDLHTREHTFEPNVWRVYLGCCSESDLADEHLYRHGQQGRGSCTLRQPNHLFRELRPDDIGVHTYHLHVGFR